MPVGCQRSIRAILVMALACACSSTERSPYAVDCPSCMGEGDAGIGATGNGGAGPGPTVQALPCLSESELELRAEQSGAAPMSGTPSQFASARFDFYDTVALVHPARILGRANGGGGLACTEWEPGTSFTLGGLDVTEDGLGPVLIEPRAADDFMPTILQRVSLSGDSPYLPVFSTAQINQIFADIGLQRDPDKGQIMALVISDTLSGAYIVDVGASVHSAYAEATAYKVDGTWTTQAEATTSDGDGLAFLANVDAFPTLQGGSPVTVSSRYQDEWILISGEGAVTYALVVAGTPP